MRGHTPSSFIELSLQTSTQSKDVFCFRPLPGGADLNGQKGHTEALQIMKDPIPDPSSI